MKLYKENNKVYILIFILTFLMSCGMEEENILLDGIWKQEGYGRILEIKDSAYVYYNTTSSSCIPLVKGKLIDRFEIVSASSNKLILNPGDIVDYVFYKADTLPQLCRTKQLLVDNNYKNNFNVFWDTFNEHYAFFNERNINWQDTYNHYKPIIDTIKSDKVFYTTLKEISNKFEDSHIRLEAPKSLREKTKKKVNTKEIKQKLKTKILETYIEKVNYYNSGLLVWGKLKEKNIGFIQISDMNDFANYNLSKELDENTFQKKYDSIMETKAPIDYFKDEIEGVNFIIPKVLKELNSTNIIIDLRFNNGGYGKVALKILEYFINQPKKVFSVYAKNGKGFTKKQHINLNPETNNYTKSIYVLTSTFSASATEVFCLGTLPYQHIKLIGSNTNGVFSEILWKKLPNGWEFSLSNEIYEDLNGNAYENIGIPSNHEINYPRNWVAFKGSFDKTGEFEDSAIQKVIDLSN